MGRLRSFLRRAFAWQPASRRCQCGKRLYPARAWKEHRGEFRETYLGRVHRLDECCSIPEEGGPVDYRNR